MADLSGGVPWGSSFVGAPSAAPQDLTKRRAGCLGVKPPAAGSERGVGA